VPSTPDRNIGPALEEDETRYEDRGASPSVVGAIGRNGNDLFGRDSQGVFNLRQPPADIFRALATTSAVLFSTTLTTPQDAFGVGLTVTAAGLYLIQFEAESRCTNSGGVANIALAINGLVEQAGTSRFVEGVPNHTTLTVAILTLAVNDVIRGTGRKISGPGTLELRGRSLFAFRIG